MKSLEKSGTRLKTRLKSKESQNIPNQLILIDMNNLCHIAHFATGDLSIEDRATGAIFGVFRQFLSLYKLFRSTDLILCWDSIASFRKRFYSEYKAQRKRTLTPEQIKNRELLYDQITLLRSEIIPDLGFKNSFVQTGYESDDIIAKICIQTRDAGTKIKIVSTDHDLYQLLEDSRVIIYNPIKKNYYTEQSFREEFDDLPPINYRLVKAIAGCHSDNVPSIVKGIGEKTALKYLSGQGGDELNKKIWAHNDVKERNFKLVALPFNEAKYPLKEFSIQPNKFKFEAFRRWFIKLGFDSFMKNFNEWEDFIGGTSSNN